LLGVTMTFAATRAGGERTALVSPAATATAEPTKPAVLGDSVGAVVNSDVITDYDLRQRVQLYVATSGVEPSAENLKKLRAQILDQLINERIQIQEAKKKNITISSPEIDKAIQRITEDNHINLDQLKEMLGRFNVQISALRSQIAAQTLWQKVVEDEFQDRINISDDDVAAEESRLARSKDKPHYEVAEIFLAVDTPEEDTKVQKNIQDLQTQLQTGAPFQVLARQFSQSPSAAAGGDIGWVYDGQLAPELNNELARMQAGSVSQPIRSTGGYYILALRERQEASNANIPDASADLPKGPIDRLPLARLLLPIGSKPSQTVIENAMKFAGQVEQRVQTCAQLAKLAPQVHGQYQDMGNFKISDLDEKLQAALAKTDMGQSVPPYTDAAGVEIIYRCDKAKPKLTAYHMPSRKEIEEQLFDQQVTAFARRYMRDLRREADVEIR
jgi:peptidyl-prolyl cis-trans isomerase SurA